MSEPSRLNGDSLAEKLGRFTPDTTGFDRDALLFQAGRASAHPRRLWPTVAGFLTLSQAATLLFFLGRVPEQPSPSVVNVPKNESPSPDFDWRSAPASDDARQFPYRRALLSGNLDELPVEKTSDNVSIPDKVLSVLSIASFLSSD